MYDLIVDQNNDNYKFSQDIHFLTDFVEVKKNDKIMEFGTGSGIIPLLLAKKKPDFESIIALELQKEQFELATKNVIDNNLSEKISIKNIDVREVRNFFESKQIDTIVSNPPFYKADSGKHSPQKGKNLSNFELTLNLDQLFDAARYLLKDKGNVFLIHIPSRIDDIIYYGKKINLI